MTIKTPGCSCRERLAYLNSLLTFDQNLFILDGWKCRLLTANYGDMSQFHNRLHRQGMQNARIVHCPSWEYIFKPLLFAYLFNLAGFIMFPKFYIIMDSNNW